MLSIVESWIMSYAALTLDDEVIDSSKQGFCRWLQEDPKSNLTKMLRSNAKRLTITGDGCSRGHPIADLMVKKSNGQSD